jgi:PPOX class probable F420-dependent enzyme
MAVVRPDGRPISVPTWYLYADGALLVNLLASRARARHLHAGAPVSLTVLADGDWYRHTSLTGTVREVLPDDDYRDADRLSEHYIGVPHTPRNGSRLSVRIDVVGWYAWRVDED